MKAFFITLALITLPANYALAVNATNSDDASYHNIIRNALSYGKTLENLGPRLNETYDFSLQNKPSSALPSLSNSTGLKSSAAGVASTCTFAHSGLVGVGENLFVGTEANTQTSSIWLSSRNWNVENAVNDWAFEARLMVYPNGASTVSCYDSELGTACNRSEIGHYTQMVWNPSDPYAYSATQEVGCAAQYCPNGVTNFSSRKSTLIVCHYSPQGNYIDNGNYVAPYAGVGVRPVTGNGSAALSAIFNLLLNN